MTLRAEVDRRWVLAILPEGVDAISRITGRVIGLRDGTIPTPPGWESEPNPDDFPGSLMALQDAVSSMIGLELIGDGDTYEATFVYGDGGEEVQFTGGDALACCRRFMAWYNELPAGGVTTHEHL